MESDKTSSRSSSTPREGGSMLSPEIVKALESPSDRMLCMLKDNYLIRFGAYSIKDYESGLVLMHITEE